MSITDPNAPPVVDTSYVAIVAGLFRTLLAAAGACGFTWALTVNASQVQMAASAACMIAAAVWSAWEKIQATRAKRAAAVDAAVASAHATQAAGVPTPVTVAVTSVTSSGEPNVGVATAVPRAEAALATTTRL